MDGMLSQEEINALLNGMGSDMPGNDTPSNDIDMSASEMLHEIPNMDEELTDVEKDAVGEISNISMGTAATTLFSLVNQKVNITTPVVTYAIWDDLIQNYDRPCVFIQLHYKEGLDGTNILVLKDRDVKIITDLMMGGDGTNTEMELTDLHLSAISEAMNQMMGSAATSISSMLERKVDISPPSAELIDLADVINSSNISEFLRGKFVKTSFRMQIGDLVDSELMQLYPFDFARDLVRQFMKYTGADVKAEELSQPAPAPAQPAPSMQQTPLYSDIPLQADNPLQSSTPPMDSFTQPMGGYSQPMSGYSQPMGGYPQPMGGFSQPMGYPSQPVPQMMQPQQVDIAPVQFQPFASNPSPLLTTEHIDLLLDVPLEVTVELGRTSKSIKEILDFAPGTIIELNRLAGEPIDVLVNGKYVAKGEVVTMDEAFAIKVTEIIKDKQ